MGGIDDRLSAGQIACLRLVAAGVTQSKAIARELNLQPGTVDSYLSRACRLLGVDSRAEAARRYLLEAGEGAESSGSPSGYRTGRLGGPAELAFHRVVAASRWLLSVPPISGPEHDLNWMGKTLAILRIAVVSLSLLAIIVIAQAGLMWLAA